MADTDIPPRPAAPVAPAGWVAGRKSVFIAYLLWFFLGNFGAHRFYLRRPRTALAQLLLAAIGWGTLWWAGLMAAPVVQQGWVVSDGVGTAFSGTADWWPLGTGALLLVPLWLWLLADLVLIPLMAARTNRALAAEFGAIPPAPAASAADELAKFADLRDRGAISEFEYEEQKRRLLG